MRYFGLSLLLFCYVTVGVGLAAETTHRTEKVIHTFQWGGGANSSAALIGGPDGVLFGTTSAGGDDKVGTVFELTPSGNAYRERVIHSFRFASGDGVEPTSGLIRDATGALYGTTWNGGTTNYGVAYKLTLTRSGFTESIMYDFGSYNGDGGTPYGALIEDGTGDLFGTTFTGGKAKLCSQGCGTVFELTPSSSGYAERILYSFQGGKDGLYPYAGLTMGADGALYGTTLRGGSSSGSNGTVFKLTPAGSAYTESILFRFSGAPADGALPYAGVVLDGAGNLYGTTASGGAGTCSYGSLSPGCGVVYKLSPSGSSYAETIVHDFSAQSDGDAPMAALIIRPDQTLVGTTVAGGIGCTYGCGTVFALTPQRGRYVKRTLYAFDKARDGLSPAGGVFADATGALFGTARGGGNHAGYCGSPGCGLVYELAP